MNILIIGCRRVGANLARVLDLDGHDVSVLAENPADLDRLSGFAGYDFGGMQFSGIPMDIDTLKGAGIEDVDAVACVTADDNVNLMAAQIARDVFHCPRVVCRVADPVTKEVYSERFGLQIVCPTNLTVETAADALLENDLPETLPFGCSTAGFLQTPAPPEAVGLTPGELVPEEGQMLLGILQEGHTLCLANQPGVRIAAGDALIWAQLLD